jgi:hypothetical protein
VFLLLWQFLAHGSHHRSLQAILSFSLPQDMLLLGTQYFLGIINLERTFKLILMERFFDRKKKISASYTEFLLTLE